MTIETVNQLVIILIFKVGVCSWQTASKGTKIGESQTVNHVNARMTRKWQWKDPQSLKYHRKVRQNKPIQNEEQKLFSVKLDRARFCMAIWLDNPTLSSIWKWGRLARGGEREAKVFGSWLSFPEAVCIYLSFLVWKEDGLVIESFQRFWWFWIWTIWWKKTH